MLVHSVHPILMSVPHQACSIRNRLNVTEPVFDPVQDGVLFENNCIPSIKEKKIIYLRLVRISIYGTVVLC